MCLHCVRVDTILYNMDVWIMVEVMIMSRFSYSEFPAHAYTREEKKLDSSVSK